MSSTNEWEERGREKAGRAFSTNASPSHGHGMQRSWFFRTDSSTDGVQHAAARPAEEERVARVEPHDARAVASVVLDLEVAAVAERDRDDRLRAPAVLRASGARAFGLTDS